MDPIKKLRLPSKKLIQGFKRKRKLFSLVKHLESLCTTKSVFLLVVSDIRKDCDYDQSNEARELYYRVVCVKDSKKLWFIFSSIMGWIKNAFGFLLVWCFLGSVLLSDGSYYHLWIKRKAHCFEGKVLNSMKMKFLVLKTQCKPCFQHFPLKFLSLLRVYS